MARRASAFPEGDVCLAAGVVRDRLCVALLYCVEVRAPRVGGIISNREGVIENDLAEAQKLKDESDQALKAYETELADARRGLRPSGPRRGTS